MTFARYAVAVRSAGSWVAAAFVVSAFGVVQNAAWAPTLVGVAVALSLILCVSVWPAARIGVFVNLALAALVFAPRPGGLAVNRR